MNLQKISLKTKTSFLLALILVVSLVPLPLVSTPASAATSATAAALATAATPASAAIPATAATPEQEVSLLFTHDMHSHFDPENTNENGSAVERGGFARLQTAINEVKRDFPDSFLFDAGDFSMGTPYQTVFSSAAAELRMMGQLGYDATTLGNHEYDYRTQGLTDMLGAALASGDTLPALTVANIDWETTLADADLRENAQALKTALDTYGNADYVVIERGGIKLAVFGLIGESAGSYAPLAGLYFKDIIETAQTVVAQIKAEANPDIIVCLSHSGTYEDPKKSEDEHLAKAVPDIDVIISGHTHVTLEQPITIGNTFIVSGGAYTQNLGHLTLKRDGERYKLANYQLIPIRENLPKDAETEKVLGAYRTLVNEQYLALFGYEFDQVLAYSPYDFTPIEEFGLAQGEDTLGNLIADSYRDAVKQAEGAAYREVDVTVVPNGVIRGSFSKGPITVADAYNASSLGIGPDGVPGYPLVSIYLTGEELKTMAEVDISVSTMMIEARLYVSGLSYTYNPSRLILNRVTDVQLMDLNGTLTELDNNKLYRVIGGLYSCQMLGEVESRSFGLLKVNPKDREGNAIVDFEQHIVRANGQELKEWVALANYLASFEAVYGTPQIPDYYNQLHQRKIENNSMSPIELLKNPNKIFFIVLAVVLVLLALVVLVVLLVARRVRRARRRRREN
ncbi:MAG: bifunctional metallophosphatase/5'-nucleotidase [Coriobacteriales bacterium]|jgi:2',3'-cyclic-nucleotide 2'-phosphodiesterase (5'-nucleotidase family)|nr:bifunctional metallophosphatase/5'-nucleotidase [Coriobacteriales bacterium]